MNNKYFVVLFPLLFMSFQLLLAAPTNVTNSTNATTVQTTVPAGPPPITAVSSATTVAPITNVTPAATPAATSGFGAVLLIVAIAVFTATVIAFHKRSKRSK